MDSRSIGMIIALALLIGCSAFFSATETAFSSLNRIRLKSKADDGDAKAIATLALAENYDQLLSAILIGNNIVNIAALRYPQCYSLAFLWAMVQRSAPQS